MAAPLCEVWFRIPMYIGQGTVWKDVTEIATNSDAIYISE